MSPKHLSPARSYATVSTLVFHVLPTLDPVLGECVFGTDCLPRDCRDREFSGLLKTVVVEPELTEPLSGPKRGCWV